MSEVSTIRKIISAISHNRPYTDFLSSRYLDIGKSRERAEEVMLDILDRRRTNKILLLKNSKVAEAIWATGHTYAYRERIANKKENGRSVVQHKHIRVANGLHGSGTLMILLTADLKAKIQRDIKTIDSLVEHLPKALTNNYFIMIVTHAYYKSDPYWYHEYEWNQNITQKDIEKMKATGQL